jgi:hypothetical protein
MWKKAPQTQVPPGRGAPHTTQALLDLSLFAPPLGVGAWTEVAGASAGPGKAEMPLMAVLREERSIRLLSMCAWMWGIAKDSANHSATVGPSASGEKAPPWMWRERAV